MKKHLVALAALAALPLVASATTPLWMRDVKISPDGKTIAFTYKGDIWTVPVTGGQAVRLTTVDSYEKTPIWSPDGKSLAFASDRHGNFDVFIMPANGGKATRLTFNSTSEVPEGFSADGKEVLYSAAIQAPASSAMFPTKRMTQLYGVPVAGGSSHQIIANPVQMISWADGAKREFFLYQDVKGFEDEWRKHHTSSVTRDIWRYDVKTGKQTNLTERQGEDRNPVVAGDKFYFLSERDGKTMNVYVADIANPGQVKAVTNFKTHPVRFLSRGADGTLCFSYDGEIYTIAQGATKPVKVNIDVMTDEDDQVEKLAVRSGAKNAVASPDGKSVAFIYRGDVFVTSVEYNTTKQITNTPEAESQLRWAPDGKSLVYVSERDGKYNIYKAEMGRADEEPNFANATIIKEEAMFKNDGHERTAPQYSPDGKKLAFILDRNKLMVMDVASKKVKQLTDGSTYATRNGSFTFVWNPDSKWIALEVSPRKHDPYYDIAIINVESGEMTNLTNSGYFDEQPHWVLGGNALAFASERYGMRNHASWGSNYDVMLVFMNQDAYDKYRLSEEDYAIRKELDKKAEKDKDKDKKSDKKDDKKGKKDNKDDGDKDADDKKDKTVKVELDGIEDRIVRVTPLSVDIKDFTMSEDGETLYYLASADKGVQLWKLDVRKGDHRMVSKVEGASYFDNDKDMKTMFVFGSSLKKYDPKGDKLTPINYSSTMSLDLAKEREYMFDYVCREEKERFYVTSMHGVDWEAMNKAYRRFLPHINNNYDFTAMLSEMLGELNVSHTGSRYNAPSSTNDDRTGSLGLLFDLNYQGKGLKVDEVIAKGPFDRASSMIGKGKIIEKINGVEIDGDNDYTTLLTDLVGKKTLVSIYDPESKSRWDEVVIPISDGANSNLLYDRWVKQRAADVDRWSNGRLGYVHIKSMNDASFRTVYSDALGKYNDREGIVIDIRWNGGGRLHEDIEVLFSGEKYFTQEIRGTETCDMPSRRWNKPSVMVMCEACYSNAHGTPWVYKHRGLGKLVGMPVPGTMTSVNWVTLQDPSMYFGIPVVGYRLPDGSFLENQQLEPDIKVVNQPDEITSGLDKQLKTAVESLLKDIDSQKSKK